MISVTNLRKDFKVFNRGSGLRGNIASIFRNDFEIKSAVDGISLEISAGEKVAYLGPNGAGKSTTIKILTGIMTPTGGECRVNGLIPYQKRTQNAQNIGVVFGQRTQLWWDLPVQDSFKILKKIYRIPDERFSRNMSWFQEILAIQDVFKTPVRKLSLGQRMMVEIAAGMVHSPKVLYLDEPTIGLDVILKDSIRALVNRFHAQENTTVILTSHDVDDIEAVCERVIVIDEGRSIYDDSISKFRLLDTLGSIKLEWDNPQHNLIDLERLIQSRFPDIQLMALDSLRAEVTYDTRKVEAKKLASFLLEKLPINDFSKTSTDLKKVVKTIYLAKGEKLN